MHKIKSMTSKGNGGILVLDCYKYQQSDTWTTHYTDTISYVGTWGALYELICGIAQPFMTILATIVKWTRFEYKKNAISQANNY